MKNNQSYIDQGGVTVITPINTSKNIRDLYDLLHQIGSDINNNTILDFKKVSTLHFGRFFIMELAKDASDELLPPQLVFTTNFDGTREAHFSELIDQVGPAFERIYDFCKGFPGPNNRGKDSIIRYLNEHIYPNQLLWPAIRGGTVEQILGEGKLREVCQNYINKLNATGKLNDLTPEGIQRLIKTHIASIPELKWALKPRAKPGLGWKLDYFGRLAGRLLLILLLLPILPIFIVIWVLILARIFEKKDDKNRKDISRSKEFDALLRNEDQIFQNQLTVYGGIKKPYWFRLTTLRIGLWIFATNGKYRSNKGKLSGIETIHFARWNIFNKGKNVMFLSNYDGGWEIYLSEFIDRSAKAMNLTFGTTVGYPMVKFLLWGGAFDEQAFKTVVRNNQYPCQVFYSAYPYLTVKNILNNHAIRKGLDGSKEESVQEWLKRF